MIAKALILAVLVLPPTPWVKNIPVAEAEPPAIEANAEMTDDDSENDLVEYRVVVEDGGIETDDESGAWNVIESCTVTHYCNCSICCGKWAGGPTASGVMPEAGRTVAVDKSVIPLGSEVEINGTVYIAEDTGVKGNHIDVFCDDHQEAKNRGMYTTTVRWR